MEADGGVAAAGEIGAQQPPVDPLQEVLAGGTGDALHAPAGENQDDEAHGGDDDESDGGEDDDESDGGEDDDESDGGEDGHHDHDPLALALQLAAPANPEAEQQAAAAAAAAQAQVDVEMGNQNPPLVPPPAAAGYQVQQEVDPLLQQEVDQIQELPPAAAWYSDQEVDPVLQQEAEQVQELPPAAPAPAAWYSADSLTWMLAGVTLVILGAVLVAELGVDVTTWATTLKEMTAKKWTVALLLAVGDITSLGLTYTPAWRFRELWMGEGAGVGAGIAALVPPVAGIINNTAWFCYGLAVDGMNASVAIINGTAVVFQSLYIFVFCARSQVPRAGKFTVVLIGVGVGVLIAIVDAFFLHGIFGLKMDDAISFSGVCTSCANYLFVTVVNMVAAHVNRGADGVPAQGLASLANAIVWLAYARLTDNLGMQVANGVGIVLFVLQVGQLLWYRLWKPQGGEGILEPLVRRTDEHV